MHAHRAQQHVGERPVSMATHDQEIRVFRSGDENRSGVALNYDLTHLKTMMGS